MKRESRKVRRLLQIAQEKNTPVAWNNYLAHVGLAVTGGAVSQRRLAIERTRQKARRHADKAGVHSSA